MDFKIHTPNFLKELCDCGLDRRMGIYKIPLNQLRQKLIELAEIGRKINNPLLNLWLFDMTIYEESDPESKDYNIKLRDKIIKKIKPEDLKKETQHNAKTKEDLKDE